MKRSRQESEQTACLTAIFNPNSRDYFRQGNHWLVIVLLLDIFFFCCTNFSFVFLYQQVSLSSFTLLHLPPTPAFISFTFFSAFFQTSFPFRYHFSLNFLFFFAIPSFYLSINFSPIFKKNPIYFLKFFTSFLLSFILITFFHSIFIFIVLFTSESRY